MQNNARAAIVIMMIGGASHVAKTTRVFHDGQGRANADPRSVVGEKLKLMTDGYVVEAQMRSECLY